MAVQIPALSLSRPVWERLTAQPAPGRVLAVFARSCLIAAHGGELLSLVLPEIGDGPLNVVVAGRPDALRAVKAGMPASLARGGLQLGGLEVTLDAARVWEPCPDWPYLRTCAAASPGWHLPLEETDRAQSAVRRWLAGIGHPVSDRMGAELWSVAGEDAVRHAVAQAEPDLRAGWAGNADALRGAARRLAGLGGGLTPAGDDFLAGLMLRAWLSHPEPEAFCQVVVDSAAPRTSALSAAFLRAAARGECSAAWHTLLGALAGEEPASLDEAVRRVLAHGHSSGADTLAGFLWMLAHDQPLDPSAC